MPLSHGFSSCAVRRPFLTADATDDSASPSPRPLTRSRGFFFSEHTMKSILSKLHAAYVDVMFAAKAHDITPAQAFFWTVAAAFIVCLPTAFFWALGTLWKATH